MKKILIPTDFSDLGDFAYDLAQKIATVTLAEIHVLSIVPATAGLLFDKAGNIKNDEENDLSPLYDQKAVLVDKMKEWISDKENITETKVKIGHIENDILRYIKEHAIDLVVMGTEGASGVEEFLRGSHAGHISLQSPIPVLSLKCDRSDMKINDLLFVCDFQKPEKMNLAILKDLQNAFGATLNLLRINTKSDFEPQRQIFSKMQTFVELNQLETVKFHIYSDESIEQGIVNFSADTGIDFVTIGTHQRGEWSRLFKKSISNKIVNHIWQPVLTFPV